MYADYQDNNGWDAIFSVYKHNPGTTGCNNFELFFKSSKGLRLVFLGEDIDIDVLISYRKWYHLCMTCNNSTIKFYVDSKFVNSVVLRNGRDIIYQADRIMLAQEVNDVEGICQANKHKSSLIGKIAQFNFWLRDLSDREITNIFDGVYPLDYCIYWDMFLNRTGISTEKVIAIP